MLQRQAIIRLSMGLHALLFTLLSCSSASDVTRQAQMSTCELVRDFSYSCETLEVSTEDGYIIEVDRVGAKGHENETILSEGAARGRPILLAPGILVESGSWFLNMPSQSTGFLLADDGYEVWAMNTREIAFRSSHLSLSQSDDRFWQWSFHQIGYYDLAAVIDLVLNTTGAAKVPLLAYSQGFTSSLVLLSMRPEYNEKVDILLGYAPVANLSHAKFPLPQLIAVSDPAFFLLDPLGDSGYLYIPDAPRAVVKLICGVLAGQPCSALFAITHFTSPDQLNKTRMPVILSHFPIGTSFQNLRHFVQVYRTMNFVMFDYGSMENKKRYGQTEPPAYPAEKATVPVALFSSQGDTVAAPGDVEALAVSLGSNLLFNHVLSDTDFRHVDFFSGYQARDLLYEAMINALKNRTVGGF